MRSLLFIPILLISGCAGEVIPQETIIPSLSFPDAGATDAPPPVCYSGGYLYTETFVSSFGNSCRDQATQTIEVNNDGSLGIDNHCTTVVTGCKSTSTGCYSSLRGTYCSITNTITFSSDGSSGTGTMDMVCYPLSCNPSGVCITIPTSPEHCVGSYNVTLTRQ